MSFSMKMVRNFVSSILHLFRTVSRTRGRSLLLALDSIDLDYWIFVLLHCILYQ
ncbi:hypothetical protein HMPREF1989_02402 [Porphyromonas gingivalis F0566]|nr:hypothetical protein HMPREF1989_02402 [Porphyromonas gingivalis F0566]